MGEHRGDVRELLKEGILSSADNSRCKITRRPTAVRCWPFRFDAGGIYVALVTKQLLMGTGVQSTVRPEESMTDRSQSYIAVAFPSTPLPRSSCNQRASAIRLHRWHRGQHHRPRVLDTRIMGVKLNPDEKRVVPPRVPGFVAVFAANVAWPGNSNINWSQSDQNLANGVVTAVDPSGAVKIRGGVNRTHVVIDVQGYFL